jgi:hypothetical protein
MVEILPQGSADNGTPSTVEPALNEGVSCQGRVIQQEKLPNRNNAWYPALHFSSNNLAHVAGSGHVGQH